MLANLVPRWASLSIFNWLAGTDELIARLSVNLPNGKSVHRDFCGNPTSLEEAAIAILSNLERLRSDMQKHGYVVVVDGRIEQCQPQPVLSTCAFGVEEWERRIRANEMDSKQ